MKKFLNRYNIEIIVLIGFIVGAFFSAFIIVALEH